MAGTADHTERSSAGTAAGGAARDAAPQPSLTDRLVELFGAVPPRTVRRGASDVIRVVLAVLALVAVTAYARATTHVEGQLAAVAADLPAALDWIFQLLWRIGSLASLVLIVGSALIFRKWRLAGSMVVAGVGAGLLAVGLAAATGLTATRTAQFGSDLVWPSFPNVRLAVATAVLLSASPFLARPARSLIRLTLVVTTISAVALVEGLTSDVLAALVVGWGMAAAARLVFGCPVGEPTADEVGLAIGELGLDAVDVRTVPRERGGITKFTALAPDGTALGVTAFGRDDTDGQLLAKVWRTVWLKDSGPGLTLTRSESVEHLALALLLAERSGARVPRLVALGGAGPRDDAVVVTAPPTGETLAGTDPSRLDDDVLDDLWRNLELLHGAGLTYGQLGPGDVLVTPERRVALVAFERSAVSAPPERVAADRAEALVTTAALVGTERAVEAALRALGPDGLEVVQPLLQPAALSPAARRLIRSDRHLLPTLRAATTAATGTAPPELVELRRVAPRHLLMVAATLLGLYLVLSQLAGIDDLAATIASADWTWVLAAFLIAFCSNFTGAVALAAAAPQHIPLGPTSVVQMAGRFTALIGGAVATLALNVRYFQRRGLAAAAAVGSGVLSNLVSITVQCSLVLICLPLSSTDLHLSETGGGGHTGWWLLLVVVVGVAVGLWVFVPRVRALVRTRVRPQVAAVRSHLTEVFRSPRRITALLGGQLGSHLLYALVLGAALHAFGQSLSLPNLILVQELSTVIATVIPVPGGIGVMEAALIAGFTAFGVPQSEAAAAAIIARMASFYVPPIWGWGALVWLGRNDFV
ncbi:MAG: flippase-like domain-containing protein [Marmoricola sp.]|nr:flippase-like domain-containing protein [Marmoricola sp.]